MAIFTANVTSTLTALSLGVGPGSLVGLKVSQITSCLIQTRVAQKKYSVHRAQIPWDSLSCYALKKFRTGIFVA